MADKGSTETTLQCVDPPCAAPGMCAMAGVCGMSLTRKTTVVDRLAALAAREHSRFYSFEEMSDAEKDNWRRVVNTVLMEATQIFLEQECKP